PRTARASRCCASTRTASPCRTRTPTTPSSASGVAGRTRTGRERSTSRRRTTATRAATAAPTPTRRPADERRLRGRGPAGGAEGVVLCPGLSRDQPAAEAPGRRAGHPRRQTLLPGGPRGPPLRLQRPLHALVQLRVERPQLHPARLPPL